MRNVYALARTSGWVSTAPGHMELLGFKASDELSGTQGRSAVVRQFGQRETGV